LSKVTLDEPELGGCVRELGNKAGTLMAFLDIYIIIIIKQHCLGKILELRWVVKWTTQR